MFFKKAVQLLIGFFVFMLCCFVALANGDGIGKGIEKGYGNHKNNGNGYVASSNYFVKHKVKKSYYSKKIFRVLVKAGSLKANVRSIAYQFGWGNVIWKSDEDYYWRGTTQLNGRSLVEIMQKMLQGYPLQAVFYQGNRVLVILPRTLKPKLK